MEVEVMRGSLAGVRGILIRKGARPSGRGDQPDSAGGVRRAGRRRRSPSAIIATLRRLRTSCLDESSSALAQQTRITYKS